jgi:hypothetical protein
VLQKSEHACSKCEKNISKNEVHVYKSYFIDDKFNEERTHCLCKAKGENKMNLFSLEVKAKSTGYTSYFKIFVA